MSSLVGSDPGLQTLRLAAAAAERCWVPPAAADAEAQLECARSELADAAAAATAEQWGCAAYPPGSDGPTWLLQLEEEAARAAGVPLLQRWRTMRDRHDAHPGRLHKVSYEGYDYIDCVHTIPAPGVFDADLVGLLALLKDARPAA